MSGGRYVSIAALAGSLLASISAATADPRAVIELFTSQGCSSCPPADNLLGEFTKDPTLIPLTLAIDTWDYLGWRDTLALTGHGNRQKAYSHMRGDREVYTPQAIINGTVQALGSDRAAIERAIAQSRRDAATLSLPLTLTVAGDHLTVAAPAAKHDEANAEVWLCPLTTSVEVAIGRGENSGHTVTYHNVVRRWTRLGVWSGKAESWSVPLDEIKSAGADAVAVILQSGDKADPGPMLGAAMMSIDKAALATPLAKP